jgi:hypothetical protein
MFGPLILLFFKGQRVIGKFEQGYVALKNYFFNHFSRMQHPKNLNKPTYAFK